MINPGGVLVSWYYRKPQNKGIILHANSHHPKLLKKKSLKTYTRRLKECHLDQTKHNARLGLLMTKLKRTDTDLEILQRSKQFVGGGVLSTEYIGPTVL